MFGHNYHFEQRDMNVILMYFTMLNRLKQDTGKIDIDWNFVSTTCAWFAWEWLYNGLLSLL